MSPPFLCILLAIAAPPPRAADGPSPRGASGTAPRGAAEPFLPPEARETVARAAEAELDSKRGAGNAMEILKAGKATFAGRPQTEAALDLRIAAVVLRAKFSTADEFPEPTRAVQALSTFSRLDLTEPGLSGWLDRAIAGNPDVTRRLGPRARWAIRAAILVRGSGLDRRQVAAAFTDAFRAAGVAFEVVDAREAPMVITVGAEDAPLEAGERTLAGVRVTVGLESIEQGKIVWEQALYRVEAAPSVEVALTSALTWAAHVAGRDLFFRWLGENAFPELKSSTPRGFAPPDRRGHAKAEKKSSGISPVGKSEDVPMRVVIPKPQGREPAPPR